MAVSVIDYRLGKSECANANHGNGETDETQVVSVGKTGRRLTNACYVNMHFVFITWLYPRANTYRNCVCGIRIVYQSTAHTTHLSRVLHAKDQESPIYGAKVHYNYTTIIL